MNSQDRARRAQNIVHEINQVMADPEGDPVLHAHRLASGPRLTQGALEIPLTFPTLPAWIAERGEPTVHADPFIGILTLRANPDTPILRIQSAHHASIGYRNPDTGEYDPHLLTEFEQQALDEYAQAVVFKMTGLATGELPNPDYSDCAQYMHPQDLLSAFDSSMSDVMQLANELSDRAASNVEAPEDRDRTALTAEALRHALTTAALLFDSLQNDVNTEIDTLPVPYNQSRWAEPE